MTWYQSIFHKYKIKDCGIEYIPSSILNLFDHIIEFLRPQMI